jgi:Tfp pilus assembly ATPase PilU
MSDGALDGMQTFDGELEKLINAEVIDKETGLSYATNRTNLQLQLETQGGANESVTPSGKFPSASSAPSKSAPRSAPSEMDDLIER